MWADLLNGFSYLFFTGKGGVGKTSLACATALFLAEQGKRTLLVSTDPASNLEEVLGVPLGAEPRLIASVANLWAANLDPEIAAQQYREKAVAPYRGLLPEATLRSIEEQFSGACTLEIAAFNEFVRLFGGDEIAKTFDVVVFDTAPTGHTLRLLSLPTAWDSFIDVSKGGMSCVGPLAQLQEQRAMYKASLNALRDGERTAVVLVARPDVSSVKEAARASQELAEMGVANQRLILNGVFSPGANPAGGVDTLASQWAARSQAVLQALPPELLALPQMQVPLLGKPVVGLDSIRLLLQPEINNSIPANNTAMPVFAPQPLEPLLAEIAKQGHGLIMTMGKGGVGKTTIAARIALHLTRLGFPVTLTTTDPAAHVADAVAGYVEAGGGLLAVERIDPKTEVATYRRNVLQTAGANLEADGIALLEEDLQSPCTEEIAVFHAFARTVSTGVDRFVVLDTAPTGHTILLLDAAEAYHREVLRTQNETPASVRELLPRLRDSDFTHIFIVTLAEPTPVHEAERLQNDLRRAGIEPFAWVINQSLSTARTSDPLLITKAKQEQAMIAEVKHLSVRQAILPWCAEPLMEK